MLPAQSQRLEHQDFACEVHHRQDMCEQTELIQGGVVDPIRAVNADDTGQDRVYAEQARREGCDLVCWGGFVLGGNGRGRRDEFSDRVSSGRRVRKKEAVIDASGVLKGNEVLDGVTYGGDRDLETKC